MAPSTTMKYSKPARPYPDLARLLLDRGMTGNLREIESYLQRVSYYRLSGYWYPFRCVEEDGGKKSRSDEFISGTRFSDMIERYEFDSELRSIVLKRIADFEVEFRTALAHEHSMQYGPFGYVDDPTCMPSMTAEAHASMLQTIQRERSRSNAEFVKHFKAKYSDDHWYMPVWTAAELMSFGTVFTWYRGSHQEIRRRVAESFLVHDNILLSWVRTIHSVRNICAHHGRLWNRVLGVKPMIPRDSDWHTPVLVENQRIFSVLTILAYLSHSDAALESWRSGLLDLLSRYQSIPKDRMGFPDDWHSSPIWMRNERDAVK